MAGGGSKGPTTFLHVLRLATLWGASREEPSLMGASGGGPEGVTTSPHFLRLATPSRSPCQAPLDFADFRGPIWLDDRGTGQWKWLDEVPRRTSLVPLAFPCFVLRLIGLETKNVLDYQGRAGDHFHCAVERSPGHIRSRDFCPFHGCPQPRGVFKTFQSEAFWADTHSLHTEFPGCVPTISARMLSVRVPGDKVLFLQWRMWWSFRWQNLKPVFSWGKSTDNLPPNIYHILRSPKFKFPSPRTSGTAFG